MQQTMANTFGSDMSATELQYNVNTKGVQDMNAYCHRSQPILRASGKVSNVNRTLSTGEVRTDYHPLVQDLYAAWNSSAVQLSLKNVDLLEAVERLAVLLNGVRITFCKSGKDRTGMAVTLEQSRQLATSYGLFSSTMSASGSSSSSATGGAGNSTNNSNGQGNSAAGLTALEGKLVQMANLMRVSGTRLMVANKNIGRPVYSINLLQARFLPPLLRPPPSVCEAMLKKDNS